MIDSTRRRGSRITSVLRLSAIGLLVLAAGCTSSNQGGNPHISAKQDRSASGVLEGLTVKGSGFAPNGQVRVTVLLAGSGPGASAYVEEDVPADASGKLLYERRPLACPASADYGNASWTLVTARDMTSGISGSAQLNPGREPDCKS